MLQVSTTLQAQLIASQLSALSINGYQLRDALSLIAPDGTPEQLACTVCIQPGPARRTNAGVEPAGLFCSLQDYPEEGSVRLDEHPRHDTALMSASDARAFEILLKVVEAARWIAAHSDKTRQPDAYRLVRAVINLASPLINSHVDALHSPSPSTALESLAS